MAPAALCMHSYTRLICARAAMQASIKSRVGVVGSAGRGASGSAGQEPICYLIKLGSLGGMLLLSHAGNSFFDFVVAGVVTYVVVSPLQIACQVCSHGLIG